MSTDYRFADHRGLTRAEAEKLAADVAADLIARGAPPAETLKIAAEVAEIYWKLHDRRRALGLPIGRPQKKRTRRAVLEEMMRQAVAGETVNPVVAAIAIKAVTAGKDER